MTVPENQKSLPEILVSNRLSFDVGRRHWPNDSPGLTPFRLRESDLRHFAQLIPRLGWWPDVRMKSVRSDPTQRSGSVSCRTAYTRSPALIWCLCQTAECPRAGLTFVVRRTDRSAHPFQATRREGSSCPREERLKPLLWST